MLNRMVIGLPRSGTTWAANWLTYAGELCAHDPLYHHHYEEWATHPGFTSVSCSGIWDWPEFVAAQTCPILVLHRPMGEIRASLLRFDKVDKGQWLGWDAEDKLRAIDGPNVTHAMWSDMFDTVAAAKLWRKLQMPSQFDVRRHQQLARMNVQPAEMHPSDASHQLHSRLMAELRAKRDHGKAGAGD